MNRQGKKRSNDGFTLVEIIVALVLAGVLVSMTGLLLAPLVHTSLQARRSADILYSSQLAMARFAREFTTTSNVVSGTASAITYDTLDSSGNAHRRTISWGGTPGGAVRLEGQVLIDDVQAFRMSYFDDVSATGQDSWGTDSTIIRVSLDMGVAGSVYTNRFFPRNVGVGGG